MTRYPQLSAATVLTKLVQSAGNLPYGFPLASVSSVMKSDPMPSLTSVLIRLLGTVVGLSCKMTDCFGAGLLEPMDS